MEKLQFRLLNADEIDCRVAQTRKSSDGAWCTILLYKDARCDQRLLDETVGAFNWKRTHELINGNLFCTVSLRDDNGEWVGKQDVGVESNTEKEKGQASDAFKRACFNWGIGRELYTAPHIFINLAPGEYSEYNGKVKPTVYLHVDTIGYDDKRNINTLIIKDKDGNVRYTLGEKKVSTSKPTQQPQVADEIRDLFDSCKAYIAGADSVQQLEKYWKDYKQLQSYEPFKQLVIARKRELS